MHQGFKVSILRYQPNYLVIYDQKYDWPSRTQAQVTNEKNLSRGSYNGYMSPKTKSKVRKYLSTWITAVEELKKSKYRNTTKKRPYLTFVTLTLPSKQRHTDNEIKRKVLAPFIQTIQRKYDVWNYYWRAESQENGNIHFHIIIDSYIDHISLRGSWNRAVEALEYISLFKMKHGHDNPNSTDIHSLRKVQNAAAYMIKYVSKDQGYRPIDGRIHGCSDRVRCLNPYEMEIDSDANEVIREAIKNPKSKVIEGETYKIIIFDKNTMRSGAFARLEKAVKAYHIDLAIDLYNNREASSEEVAKAEEFRYQDQLEYPYLQMGIAFDYVAENYFHGSDNF